MLTRLTILGGGVFAILVLALVSAAAAFGSAMPSVELAYMSYVAINPDIYLTDLPRSITRNLTDHPAYDAAPVWSPDGRWLAFVSDRDGFQTVFLLAHGETQPRRLVDDGEIYVAPRWLSNSRQLVVRAPRQGAAVFYLVNHDGGDLTLVQDGINPTTGREIDLDLQVAGGTQARSPDGSLFAFMAFRGQRWGIFVSPQPHQQDARFLAEIGYFTEGLAWSPAGDHIAYTAYLDGMIDLFAVDVAKGEPQRLTSGRAIDTAPAWRPQP
ncbi:MAG: PD40 domain-containing protein [Anaerolineae bacterium]|nr:PD40 domain-containing protein [Anaerolineae bacterium]